MSIGISHSLEFRTVLSSTQSDLVRILVSHESRVILLRLLGLSSAVTLGNSFPVDSYCRHLKYAYTFQRTSISPFQPILDLKQCLVKSFLNTFSSAFLLFTLLMQRKLEKVEKILKLFQKTF